MACWVLWTQFRREQEDNVHLRDKFATDLTGVMDRNSKVIERVEEVMRKGGGDVCGRGVLQLDTDRLTRTEHTPRPSPLLRTSKES